LCFVLWNWYLVALLMVLLTRGQSTKHKAQSTNPAVHHFLATTVRLVVF
jgi:hypothetical protein